MEEIYCFAGNPLDRASERRRDTAWIGELLADPAARLLPLSELRPLTRGTDRLQLDWQPVEPWREPIERGATLIFLGLDDGRPHFAIDAGTAEIAGADREPIDARSLAPLLPGGEAAIVAEARSLIDWHARHRFCAQCGAPTRVESAGWVRRCPECKASHYPRSDPTTRHSCHCRGRSRSRITSAGAGRTGWITCSAGIPASIGGREHEEKRAPRYRSRLGAARRRMRRHGRRGGVEGAMR